MSELWRIILASSVVLIVMISVIAAIYYVVASRNLKRRREHFEQLHKNLKPQQKVAFANGLQGKVIYVSDETCDIEVKSGAVITVSRYAISELLD